ncbi:MAG TPA: FAD-binding protein [Pseudonocardiaceae bacterium]|nr:FAD-binding protein [Pseudonocardiaceae bacterium]
MPDSAVDVVVLGYGGAGAMAALSACDAGASVLLVDKMATGGGSTHEAGGTLRPPRDPDLAATHYAALSGGTTPLDMMRTLAHGETRLRDKLTALGATFSDFRLPPAPFPARRDDSAYPGIEGSAGLGERIRVAGEPGQGGGEALWELLAATIAGKPIEVALGQRGTRLLRDPVTERVTGVELTDERGEVSVVTARGGVVLACGGFGHDDALKRDYLGADVGALSPPGRATGDGIRMAARVGAGMWHMTSVSCTFGYRFAGHVSAFYAQMPAHGYFMVDRTGNRFCDETAVENHAVLNLLGVRNPRTGQYDRIPGCVIFDETTRLAGRVFNPSVGENRHFDWSQDNGAEVERGWITTAGSIRELADRLELPAAALERTHRRFREGVAAGRDEFGRPAARLADVGTPPYYAVRVWPSLLNTQGGPRRDTEARVLDAVGEPIPGLYSAGELGSVWGALYPGSGNVAEALVFGEIAGRNAAVGRAA